jgi:hypothetical protein
MAMKYGRFQNKSVNFKDFLTSNVALSLLALSPSRLVI